MNDRKDWLVSAAWTVVWFAVVVAIYAGLLWIRGDL